MTGLGWYTRGPLRVSCKATCVSARDQGAPRRRSGTSSQPGALLVPVQQGDIPSAPSSGTGKASRCQCSRAINHGACNPLPYCPECLRSPGSLGRRRWLSAGQCAGGGTRWHRPALLPAWGHQEWGQGQRAARMGQEIAPLQPREPEGDAAGWHGTFSGVRGAAGRPVLGHRWGQIRLSLQASPVGTKPGALGASAAPAGLRTEHRGLLPLSERARPQALGLLTYSRALIRQRSELTTLSRLLPSAGGHRAAAQLVSSKANRRRLGRAGLAPRAGSFSLPRGFSVVGRAACPPRCLRPPGINASLRDRSTSSVGRGARARSSPAGPGRGMPTWHRQPPGGCSSSSAGLGLNRKAGARHLGTGSRLHFTAAFFGCWGLSASLEARPGRPPAPRAWGGFSPTASPTPAERDGVRGRGQVHTDVGFFRPLWLCLGSLCPSCPR